MPRGRLSQRELALLRFLRARPARTRQIAAEVLHSPRTNFGRQQTREAERLLHALERHELVARSGRWRASWHVTDKGREAISKTLLDLPENLLNQVRLSPHPARLSDN